MTTKAILKELVGYESTTSKYDTLALYVLVYRVYQKMETIQQRPGSSTYAERTVGGRTVFCTLELLAKRHCCQAAHAGKVVTSLNSLWTATRKRWSFTFVAQDNGGLSTTWLVTSRSFPRSVLLPQVQVWSWSSYIGRCTVMTYRGQ